MMYRERIVIAMLIIGYRWFKSRISMFWVWMDKKKKLPEKNSSWLHRELLSTLYSLKRLLFNLMFTSNWRVVCIEFILFIESVL